MATFPAGTDVTITIPFQDASGGAITPTGASYSVMDELETVVVPKVDAPADALGADGLTITIPASANQLQPPVTEYPSGDMVGVPFVSSSGLREVDVVFATAKGPVPVVLRYVIGQPKQLFVMQNSFQTFNQALLTAMGMPNLNGWNLPDTTDDQRVAALIEAHLRLTRLGYYVRWPIDPDAQSYINWGMTQNAVIIPRLWTVMSIERWQTFYPEVFRAAMRKAQVAEADQVLQGDPVLSKRNQGIISEKTGESSMMFRGKKPLNLGVSAEALSYLTGFVDFRMAIERG